MTSFRGIQDPQDTDQHTIEWHNWLKGETITTSTWTITGNESPLALIQESDSISTYTGQSPVLLLSNANVVISGGTLGVVYTLTNHVVSSGGREKDSSIEITIIQL